MAFETIRSFNRMSSKGHNMDLLATVTRNIIAPLWAIWENSPYLNHYRKLLRTQYLPFDMIRQMQNTSIEQLAKHAFHTSTFWNQKFRDNNLTPSDVQTVDDLSKLSVLTKQDIRNHFEAIRSESYSSENVIKHTTSGSTGVSITVYLDELCQQLKRGATLRSDEWSGWRLGERVACVWGNPQIRTDWRGIVRRKLLERDYLYLDTLRMSSRSMSEFIRKMSSTPPSLLFGHAHSLYLLARFCRDKHPNATIRPNGIISTCMVLHDFERNEIESVFRTRVTNRYGCEEVGLIASECERHNGMHVNSELVYVEILDKHGQHCRSNQPGRIVVTDLSNQAMPLFRYEVGDMGAWSSHCCSCGRTLPLLAKVEGRTADYVVTSSGDYISGISLTENFAVKVPGVAQMQIVQEDFERFTFNIVKGADFGPHSLTEIESLVRQRFGEGTNYKCVYVDHIPPERSGKYRFCISHVNKAM
jgi:phenylacetate-CoA ligase